MFVRGKDGAYLIHPPVDGVLLVRVAHACHGVEVEVLSYSQKVEEELALWDEGCGSTG